MLVCINNSIRAATAANQAKVAALQKHNTCSLQHLVHSSGSKRSTGHKGYFGDVSSTTFSRRRWLREADTRHSWSFLSSGSRSTAATTIACSRFSPKRKWHHGDALLITVRRCDWAKETSTISVWFLIGCCHVGVKTSGSKTSKTPPLPVHLKLVTLQHFIWVVVVVNIAVFPL